MSSWLAGGLVLPLDFEFHVLVSACLRQVLFEQVELADERAAGRAVDGRILRADGDADRFSRGIDGRR
jgi:hypothetical protein